MQLRSRIGSKNSSESKGGNMTIGEKIIGECILDMNEAETVYHDIQELHNKGVWHTPDWAKEVSSHLKTTSSNVVVFVAWRAVAMAYRKAYPIYDAKDMIGP